MSNTVFLGNLPAWVTADDIKQWLFSDNLVADSVKVIRNHETQESKGFAFVEAPTAEEMQAIIRRFDRAPLEDKLLRANAAQPSKGKVQPGNQVANRDNRSVNGPNRTFGTNGKRKGRERSPEPQSAFATELAKAL